MRALCNARVELECPVCDVESLNGLDAFAYGVILGGSFADPESYVETRCCESHRLEFFEAVVRAGCAP